MYNCRIARLFFFFFWCTLNFHRELPNARYCSKDIRLMYMRYQLSLMKPNNCKMEVMYFLISTVVPIRDLIRCQKFCHLTTFSNIASDWLSAAPPSDRKLFNKTAVCYHSVSRPDKMFYRKITWFCKPPRQHCCRHAWFFPSGIIFLFPNSMKLSMDSLTLTGIIHNINQTKHLRYIRFLGSLLQISTNYVT